MSVTKLYAALLRLYPRPFYERFGDEMQFVFTQAWQNRAAGPWRLVTLLLREFSGLLTSVYRERWTAYRVTGRPVFFDWRLMLPLLVSISVVAACAFSLSYWGYITRPASIFDQLARIDRATFVRFDSNAQPNPIALRGMANTPDGDGLDLLPFPPPSLYPFQLTSAQIHLLTHGALPLDLSEAVTVALAQENIALGRTPLELPRPVTLRPNGCDQCFYEGIALQPDGNLQTAWPQTDAAGHFTTTNDYFTIHPTDTFYHMRLLPAGFIIEGQADDGTPLVFASIVSNALGGDRYRYYEFMYERDTNGSLSLRASMQFRFDWAGLEGLEAPFMSILFSVLLVLIWLLLVVVASTTLAVKRRIDKQQMMRRA